MRELLEMDDADDDSVSDPCGNSNLEVYLILAFILNEKLHWNFREDEMMLPVIGIYGLY